jgi:HK97 family phage prohead protease
MTDTLAEPIVETRSGDGYQVADVNYPKRIVTVIAMPYERPTEIVERGGAFVEVVTRGAFDGIEKRTSKIRANRDHSWDKPVGKVVALHPSRTEGLVAEVRISRTPDGDATLELCEDDVLSASAGFGLLRRDDGRVWDDAEVWSDDRTVRRLNRLWLDHLAFVPNPAYPDAAVVSVRHTPGRPQEAPQGEQVSVSTPNLTQHRTEALAALYADMDRRYSRPSE